MQSSLEFYYHLIIFYPVAELYFLPSLLIIGFEIF